MARPILEALGYTKPMQPIVQDGDVRVPHIWWVPTGPLTVFPLHAAGLHKKNSGETVLDRVVSSYASSVRSLRHARGRPTSLEPSGPGASPGNDLKQRALLVAVENTPGLPSLMSAVEEIKNAKMAVESMGMQVFDKSSSCVKHDIAEQLRTCDWFHFAGHGYTAPDDASKSSLIFRAPDNPNNNDVDRQENSLTIAELLNMELAYRVGQPAPFLAYLSACGTGRMRDEQSRDESIHLASAFQLAGFRHVVGTLWNVQDAVCKEVASLTYQTIQSEWEKNKTWTDESVALALHHALRVMRDKRISQNGDDRGESGRDMQLVEEDEWADWAPFVHFGV
jgi:CHAT domain-containing protein